MTTRNSYAYLPSQSKSIDSDGVFFSLQGPNMRVPMAFYRKVTEYILGLPAPTKKDFPQVSDPQMFCESLILMIKWEEDVANGFILELAPGASDEMRAGKDYIPTYFRKKPIQK